MTFDTPALVLYALLVVVRLWGLRARWNMATYRGEGWFFDGRVEGDAILRALVLNVPRPRVGLRDPENLRLGGLVYVNRENPSVIVDGGPLRLSVNVMNWITYVYVGYWIGWAVLMTKLAEAV